MKSTLKWIDLGDIVQQEALVFFDSDFCIRKVMLKFGGVLVDCEMELSASARSALEEEIYAEENGFDNGDLFFESERKAA